MTSLFLQCSRSVLVSSFAVGRVAARSTTVSLECFWSRWGDGLVVRDFKVAAYVETGWHVGCGPVWVEILAEDDCSCR